MQIIIVLGNRNNIIMRKRVDRALKEFNTFPAKQYSDYTGRREIVRKILFSGGASNGVSQPSALMMKEYAMKSIPEEFIMVETKSQTTVENLQFSKNLLDQLYTKTLGYKPSLVICTSTFHIKRSIIQSRLILEGYPLRFIHTDEHVTPEEYEREAHILNKYIDEYCQNCI